MKKIYVLLVFACVATLNVSLGQDIMPMRSNIHIDAGEKLITYVGVKTHFIATVTSTDIIKSIKWDFDGDHVYDVTQTTPTVTYTYSSAGHYKVSILVTTENNERQEAGLIVEVKEGSGEQKYVPYEKEKKTLLKSGGTPVDRAAIIICGSEHNKDYYSKDAERMYDLLINKELFTASDIYMFKPIDWTPGNKPPKVYEAVSRNNIITLLEDMAINTPKHLFIYTTGHGAGYAGENAVYPYDGKYFITTGAKIRSACNNEYDFIEKDFKLQVNISINTVDTTNTYDLVAKKVKLGEWVIQDDYENNDIYYRIYAASKYTNVLGYSAPGNEKIDVIVNYHQNDVDKDGRITGNEKTGFVKNDNWSSNHIRFTDVNEEDGIPKVKLDIPSLQCYIFDKDNDNRLDIDIGYTDDYYYRWFDKDGINLSNPVSDGCDTDNDGIIDYIDVNQDGDLFDAVSVNEGIEVINDKKKEILYDYELKEYLDNIESESQIMVMDNCYSGGFVNNLSACNRIIITGGAEGDLTWSSSILDGGIFSHFFRDALEKNSNKSIAEIFSVAFNNTRSYNWPVSNPNMNELPQYDDNGDGKSIPQSKIATIELPYQKNGYLGQYVTINSHDLAPLNLILNGDASSDTTIKARNSITSTQTVDGVDVTYIAGNSISLTKGFNASYKNNTHFHAYADETLDRCFENKEIYRDCVCEGEPDAGEDVTLCGYYYYDLHATPSSSGLHGLWEVVNGPANNEWKSSDTNARFNHGGNFGEYTLRWTDYTMCGSFSDEITINFIEDDLTVDAGSSDMHFCTGEEKLLGGFPTANGTGGYTYSWSAQNSSFTSDIANPSIKPVVDDIITLSVTDTNGCTETDIVNIHLYEYPIVDAGTDTTICNGQSVTLGGSPTASGASGDYLYKWKKGGSLIDGWNQTNPEVSPLSTSTYTVEVISSYSGVYSCRSTDDIVVSVESSPIASAGSGGTVEDNLYFDLNATPPSYGNGTWTYSSNDGEVIDWGIGQNNASTTVTVNNYGTYNFKWCVTNPCGYDCDSVQVIFTETGCGTVDYGGITYNTVWIGDQCWLKENLNVGNYITSSTNSTDNSIIEKYCYEDNVSNCDTFGGLYQWNEMMDYNPSDTTNPGITKGICPSGWHLPTQSEWEDLVDYIGGISNGGDELIVGGSSGFDAVATGLYINGNFDFPYMTGYWTSTENSTNNDLAYVLYFQGTGGSITNDVSYLKNTCFFAVRCIKNSTKKSFKSYNANHTKEEDLQKSFSTVNDTTYSQVTVYPNPSDGTVNVQVDNFELPYIYIIYNMGGIRLKTAKVDANTTTINLTNYPKGIYTIKFITNKMVITKQLIYQ